VTGPTPETVVIVHGLWTHGVVMALVRRRIARGGFAARTFSYPSVRATLGENADALARCLGETGGPPAHLLGHSLGGLVILQMLARHPDLRTGRIVLVATPYGGPVAGARLAELGGERLLGRSVREWMDGPRPAGFPGTEIGVIAGSLGIGLGRLAGVRFAGRGDGVVGMDETAVPGMRDRVILRVNHTGMLIAPSVARQACAFFRQGMFEHGDPR
jgi:pimeloyl-ACP methyl ester carboxylesterase